jgi:hypothetical protein
MLSSTMKPIKPKLTLSERSDYTTWRDDPEPIRPAGSSSRPRKRSNPLNSSSLSGGLTRLGSVMRRNAASGPLPARQLGRSPSLWRRSSKWRAGAPTGGFNADRVQVDHNGVPVVNDGDQGVSRPFNVEVSFLWYLQY